MTHAEIHAAITRLIPYDLMQSYGYLSYAEMAEVPELSAWANALKWADEQWNKANAHEAVSS